MENYQTFDSMLFCKDTECIKTYLVAQSVHKEFKVNIWDSLQL